MSFGADRVGLGLWKSHPDRVRVLAGEIGVREVQTRVTFVSATSGFTRKLGSMLLPSSTPTVDANDLKAHLRENGTGLPNGFSQTMFESSLTRRSP